MTLSIILSSIFIALISLSCLISFLILVRIFIHIHPSISNISVLLSCNTYFTIILFCFTLLYAGIHNLYGHINSPISLAGRWCEIRAYLPYVCFCAFYYSFVLQAIFRFFRVVYYKKKILQKFYVFIIAIFIQWILSFLFIFPHILLNDFQYQSLNYNCWISFRNIRGILLVTLSIYICPLSIIFIIYTYILRYVRRTITSQRERQKSYKRDTIILRRIVILLLFLVMFGVSTLSVLVIYSITNYLIPFAYEIQVVSISIGLVVTPITLIFITPKIRHIFERNEQVKCSSMTRRNIQHTTTDSSRQQTQLISI
ncbi:unnamed protein product [Rotaria sp. Silwood2]|nr:unnamed protein product [Rotaria sp. Silwood2]CAF3114397.1 unnamed protein product [Rotaria sp. Silwood2]CAF4206008.1 unnamed protein product [Rotaria sp. Silwood2]